MLHLLSAVICGPTEAPGGSGWLDGERGEIISAIRFSLDYALAFGAHYIMRVLVDLTCQLPHRCWKTSLSLPAEHRRRSPSGPTCLGGGRACFLDQAKHGPQERHAQAGTGLLLAGRTDTGNRSLQPPGPCRGSQLGKLQTRRGSRTPCTVAAREFVILTPPCHGMTAGRRGGGCLLLLLREASCH